MTPYRQEHGPPTTSSWLLAGLRTLFRTLLYDLINPKPWVIGLVYLFPPFAGIVAMTLKLGGMKSTTVLTQTVDEMGDTWANITWLFEPGLLGMLLGWGFGLEPWSIAGLALILTAITWIVLFRLVSLVD